MTDIVFLALLFIHIGTVILWMGAAMLYLSVLAPSISKLAGATRAELMKSIGPSYEKYVVRNATISIAAGLILYAYINGYIVPVSASLAPSMGGMLWLGIGILSALIAYIIGLAVVMRTNRKMMKLMGEAQAATASTAPSGEMVGLQRRLRMGAGLQALFLMIALLCMVVGANL